MQYNTIPVTNLLIHQKALHIRPLIPTQLNHFPCFLILLYGPVARKILFERLANPFDIQVIGQAGHSRNTFASAPLLHTDVDLVFGFLDATLVGTVVKGVYRFTGNL